MDSQRHLVGMEHPALSSSAWVSSPPLLASLGGLMNSIFLGF